MPTVLQLKQECRKNGVSGYSTMKKAELVKACSSPFQRRCSDELVSSCRKKKRVCSKNVSRTRCHLPGRKTPSMRKKSSRRKSTKRSSSKRRKSVSVLPQFTGPRIPPRIPQYTAPTAVKKQLALMGPQLALPPIISTLPKEDVGLVKAAINIATASGIPSPTIATEVTTVRDENTAVEAVVELAEKSADAVTSKPNVSPEVIEKIEQAEAVLDAAKATGFAAGVKNAAWDLLGAVGRGLGAVGSGIGTVVDTITGTPGDDEAFYDAQLDDGMHFNFRGRKSARRSKRKSARRSGRQSRTRK